MTFTWRRRFALLAALAAPAVPGSAAAHAILVESKPAIGGTIAPGNDSLQLRYNSRIDRARSRLTLTRPDKTQAVLPIDRTGPDDVLTATVALTPGAYTLRWQVLAIDGHITRGDVPFTVTGQ
jgi:methionine-rich copper-binding protein CopC